jgi:cell division protein FtsW (lipid II flippase)
MQDLIDKMMSNPLYLTVGVILIVALLYAIMKRIMKLLILLFVAILLFLAYVHYTGNSVKYEVEKMTR